MTETTANAAFFAIMFTIWMLIFHELSKKDDDGDDDDSGTPLQDFDYELQPTTCDSV